MKKLLLASTALVLSAGVASAQGVSLSGDARMGLVYDGSDVQMTSRARVTFTLSGETDTGLAFGASFRADQIAAANGNTAMTGGNVFISGDFGRLSMGDVAGAARAAVGDLYGVGLTGLGDLNDMTYVDRLTQGGARVSAFDRRTAALYQYSIDGFTVYASVAQPHRARFGDDPLAAGPDAGFNLIAGGPGPLLAGETYRERQFAVGAKYSFDGLTVSAGHEHFRSSSNLFTNQTASHTIVGVEYEMDGLKAKAIAGRAGGDLRNNVASRNQYGLSVQGTFDATTVTAFARRDFARTRAVGIGASYDLGGGASIVGGAVRAAGTTQADFGLSFSF